MRTDLLPSPGYYHNGQRLRVECAKAISHVEIVARPLNAGAAVTLRDFFVACAAACADVKSEFDPD